MIIVLLEITVGARMPRLSYVIHLRLLRRVGDKAVRLPTKMAKPSILLHQVHKQPVTELVDHIQIHILSRINCTSEGGRSLEFIMQE